MRRGGYYHSGITLSSSNTGLQGKNRAGTFLDPSAGVKYHRFSVRLSFTTGGLIMRKAVALALLAGITLWSLPAAAQEARTATVEPETKARIVLQSHLSSKLNEAGDTITAVLYEPVHVDGQLVMSRGTEFHGRIASVSPAKRGQKSAQMTIIFDKVAMPWGEEPVSVVMTSIDDWARDEKLKADDEGKVKGGHRGEKTAENVERGAKIGGGAAGTVILAGAAAGGGAGVLGLGAAALGGGMLAGLLLTKGGEVRLQPGTIFRIKFVKPITLPVIQQAGAAPRPIQQDDKPEKPEKPPVSSAN